MFYHSFRIQFYLIHSRGLQFSSFSFSFLSAIWVLFHSYFLLSNMFLQKGIFCKRKWKQTKNCPEKRFLSFFLQIRHYFRKYKKKKIENRENGAHSCWRQRKLEIKKKVSTFDGPCFSVVSKTVFFFFYLCINSSIT